MNHSRALDENLTRVLPPHSTVTPEGELEIGGCKVTDIAREFGTPVYLYDEAGLRTTMRAYRDGLAKRWPSTRVCFASKSLPCVAAYAIAASEGLSVDVAGEGELRLALAAGVDPATIVLHGNAKSHSELSLAVTSGVGTIVVDNEDDIDTLETIATAQVNVLIRIIPEIDARTHPSIATGGKDSKFGLPVDDALSLIQRLQGHAHIHVNGVHLHLGSQIMQTEPFVEAVAVLGRLGHFEQYNLGGGLGVNYSDDDDAPTLDEYLDRLTEAARKSLPSDATLILEPGRSLVARNGVSVYEIRNVKHSHKTFVAIDGGLSDQMSIAMTDTVYTPVIANRPTETPNTTAQLVGRQCESGDLFVDGAKLHSPEAGDTVVLATAGAYGYTLVNNYNGALHPPVVFCADGAARLAVRRQTYDAFLAPHEPALREDWGA